MNEETLRLAKEGLADLLDKVKNQDLAPDRLAVIAAAKFGIKVAEDLAGDRGLKLTNRPYRYGVWKDEV